MKNLPANRTEFEASILDAAVSFRVHLFLGRGQFDRHEVATLPEAIETGRAMKAAHPNVNGEAMIYAIEASGHSTIVPQSAISEKASTMLNVTSTEVSANATPVVDAAAVKRAKNAERMRAARAAAKDAKAAAKLAQDKPDVVALLSAFTGEDVGAAIEASAAPAGWDVIDLGGEVAATIAAEVAADEKHCAQIEGEIEQIIAQRIAEPETVAPASPTAVERIAKMGLRGTRDEAQRAAVAVFGEGAKIDKDYRLKKTVHGEWFWGPMEIAPANSEPAQAATTPREAKATKVTAKAIMPAGEAAPSGKSLPKPQTRNSIIVAHLTREEGATKAEIDAALIAFQPDRPANCGIRSDARIFGARLGFRVVEASDNGAARFKLVKP